VRNFWKFLEKFWKFLEKCGKIPARRDFSLLSLMLIGGAVGFQIGFVLHNTRTDRKVSSKGKRQKAKGKSKVSASGRDCFIASCDFGHCLSSRSSIFHSGAQKRRASYIGPTGSFLSKIRVFLEGARGVSACIDRNKKNFSRKVFSLVMMAF